MRAKRRRSAGKWLALALLCIPVGYVVLQVLHLANRPYTVQPAVAYRMADTLACSGVLGTQETEVAWTPGSGTLSYVAYNGERVSAGTAVAQVFASQQAAESYTRYQQLQQELEVLEESQASLESFSLDLESLTRQKQNDVYDVLDAVETGDYADVPALRSELQLAQNKILANTGAVTDFTPRIQALTAQRDAALAAAQATPITAPAAGYFVSGQDSEKKQFTLEQLQAMTPAQLQEAAAQPPQSNDAAVAGKLVMDYHWRFFTAVSLEDAEKFREGESVTLSFHNLSGEEFPMEVESVQTDEETGLAKVVLVCNYINGTVVTQEQTQATISFTVYEGLRIPAAARHTVDGQDCVYVKFGDRAYQCPIRILYEDDTYVLVSDEWQEDVNELELYDEVIVEGMDLYHGKVLD